MAEVTAEVPKVTAGVGAVGKVATTLSTAVPGVKTAATVGVVEAGWKPVAIPGEKASGGIIGAAWKAKAHTMTTCAVWKVKAHRIPEVMTKMSGKSVSGSEVAAEEKQQRRRGEIGAAAAAGKRRTDEIIGAERVEKVTEENGAEETATKEMAWKRERMKLMSTI